MYCYNYITWAPWWFKSPTTPLFLEQSFMLATTKDQRSPLLVLRDGNKPWTEIVEIGRSPDRLISTLGFPELIRRHRYIETWLRSYPIPSVNVAVSATQIVRYLLVVAILGCHQETGNVKHLQGNRRLFTGDHVVDLVPKEWWHTIKGVSYYRYGVQKNHPSLRTLCAVEGIVSRRWLRISA